MTRSPLRWCVIFLAVFLAFGELAVLTGPAGARSLSGAYLAARQAAQRNDLTAASEYFSAALAMEPRDDLLRAQTMNFAVMAGDFERAATIARALAESDPNNQMATIILTVDDIAADRLESARRRLEERREAFTPLLAGLLAGWIEFGLGDLEAAEAAFGALDSNSMFSTFGKHHLGLAHAAAGDHVWADTLFTDAAELAGRRTPRMALAHGASLAAMGAGEEARAIYDEALADDPGDRVVAEALARLEAGEPPAPIVETAQEGAAEVMFDLAQGLAGQNSSLALVYVRFAAHLRPDLDEARILIGDILEAQDQHALAIEAYDEVDDASPHRLVAGIGRAEALQSLERIDEAEAALRNLAAEFPGAIQAHFALGELLSIEERFEEAAEPFSDAVALLDTPRRSNWLLFYRRGIAYERSGRWAEAEADFRKALELAPDQPHVLNYLGYSLVEKRRNLDEAQRMIEKAVAQRPDDGYMTDSLGWVLYRLGKYDEAVEHMETAVELMPVDPVVNDHLGDVLWKVGRKLEAAFQWRRALSFDPEKEDAERIREKLKRGLDAVLEDEADEAASHADGGTNGG